MSNPMTYFKTGYTADQIPDLTGKVAIVTGGNTGLGLETVLNLARKGARVFMASRSLERAAAAIEKLKLEIGSEAAARVEALQLDLQDLKQVKAAAQQFLDKKLPLHILVNNAGIMAPPFGLTKDGIETQLGTNHVGHFAFTLALLPALEKETPSRVVNLSSWGHNMTPKGGIVFDKINDEMAMNSWERYGQSKLANVLFTKGFDKRFGERGIFCNACHPGAVETELTRGPKELYGLDKGFMSIFTPVLAFFIWTVSLNVKQGALTQTYLASSPVITEKGIKGKYFIPFAHELDGPGLSDLAKDPELADKLWDWTEKIVADKSGE